jgi:hypothetical protein
MHAHAAAVQQVQRHVLTSLSFTTSFIVSSCITAQAGDEIADHEVMLHSIVTISMRMCLLCRARLVKICANGLTVQLPSGCAIALPVA